MTLCFWIINKEYRQRLVLFSGLAFYALWDLRYAMLPATIAVLLWTLSWFASKRPGRKALSLWIGASVILSVLAFFKYRDFFLNVFFPRVVVRMAHWDRTLGVPVGLSFLSFAAIGYLIDFRQGRIKLSRFADVLTFLSFWPSAAAGPILRFRELGPQFGFDRPFDIRFLVRGLDRVIWGLVQKNLFANSLDSWVREGFMPAAAQANSTVDNWFLAAAYGMQIYFDFASYSNIAIGAAELIGVTLPENFRFPYHALNPSEFWSRWHMSLSRWIRDYLFFPLSARFRDSSISFYASLVGVMALVGLWHGAGWGFVLWGVMHGTYLVVHRIWLALRRPSGTINNDGKISRIVWRALTLLAVMAAWIPFRSATIGQALIMFKSMFVGFTFGFSYSINFYMTIALLAAVVAIEPYVSAWLVWVDECALRRRSVWLGNVFVLRPLLFAVGLFVFIIFDDRDLQFIYFQF
jgi:alginate O-acetyltransferase complex protein AlgI